MSEAATQPNQMATFTVTPEEHFRFSAFSGDRNPMHTDAVFARRTLPGAIAAYGMHLLLWALNALAEQGHLDARLRRIRVRFVRWVYLGDTVRLLVSSIDSSLPKRVELFVDEVLVVVIDLTDTAHAEEQTSMHGDVQHARRTIAAEHSLEALEGSYGIVPNCSAHEAASYFPALARVLGAEIAADIASVSYVVGMEAPGLHSIDSRADWTLHRHTGEEQSAFAYRVDSVDERFRLARIAVQGTLLQGKVEALVRRPPVQQMSLAEVQTRVHSDEFQTVRALVIGGSRGVGEATVKLLLAGGANVTLTYAQGELEAKALLAEARHAGLSLHLARLDVSQEDLPLPSSLQPWTHLFYFATGPMFQQRTAADADRAARQMQTRYVDEFARVIHGMQRGTVSPLVVFYPSTELIDTAPQEHEAWINAKLAGEAVCHGWNVQKRGVTAVVERLPRMRTDQTAAVLPQRDADPVEVMLPIVRRLAAL